MKNRTLLSCAFLTAVLSLSADSLLWADLVVPSAEAPSEPMAPAPAPASASAAIPTPALPVLQYTVAHGDTLASVAEKFGMTVKELKRLNDLPTTKVSIKAGQVLQVVEVSHAAAARKTALAAKKKKATTPTGAVPPEYTVAQPVQNFDLPPAAGHASVAATPDYNEYSVSAPAAAAHDAPVAKLATPAELAREEARQNGAMRTPSPATKTAAPVISAKHAPRALPVVADNAITTPPPASAPQLQLNTRKPQSFFDRIFSNHDEEASSADAWGSRFLQQARSLGDEGIGYDDDWRPPGESHSWSMDCSNTARYLYRVTTGIELPRTASDQYYYLHLQHKAWDVPQGSDGFADTNFLRRNLKPGDLLFWENTYRPQRQPPITHVMIFLGTNDKGQWIMAGSQTSRGGEHNRSNGGPDIYVFRPSQPCGGYTTWLGLVHHQGRFCAFGRPLDADRSKLSVASDN